jgi:tetratricopeptide (TPR) repeat protein
MTPTIPPGGSSLIALGAKQLAAFLKRNEVKNLLGIVAAEVAKTPGVAPDKVDGVRSMIMNLRIDPQIMGGLKRLLDDGDVTATPLLQKRLEEILVPTDPGLASLGLPAIAAQSFEANASAAKRDDRGTSRVEGQLTRSLIREQVSDLKREMKEGFGDRGSAGSAPPAGPIPDPGFSSGTARILKALEKIDPTAARQLSEALEAGGSARVSELIENEQQWMQSGGAGLWVSLGKLADRNGSFDAAESAYLKAAEMPDVVDRARQLVRASGSARLCGEDARAEGLLTQAEEIDPGNPALATAAARRIDDPEEILSLVAGVEPRDDEQAILVELIRAGAESARRDFGRVGARLETARRLDPESPMVREFAANVVLMRTQLGLPDEAPIERRELVEAADDLAVLARELGTDGRTGASATLLARASQASSLAEDFDRGNQLIEEALALEDRGEAGEAIAEAALLLRRFELVDSLEMGDGETARLNRATSRVLGEREVKSAAEELDRLITSADEGIVARAAFMRLAAASPVHDVPWSDEAEQLIGSEKPEAVAILKAEFLAEDGQFSEAERTLAPFSSAAAPLRHLIDLAVRREELETALRLSEELITRYGEPRDRLNHAGLLAQKGERETARDRFLMLARDAAIPPDVRARAYGRAADLVMNMGDLVELARLSKEWLSFAPVEEDPVWLHVFALARRRHYGEALSFWQKHEVDPKELRQAILLSEVYGFGAEPSMALVRIAALSDSFERPEELEFNLMSTALRTGGKARENLDEALEDRIKKTFADFPERFPDSEWLQAFKIDKDDPGAFLDTIRPQLEARAELGSSLFEEVRNGTAATHVLAAGSGRSVGEVWAGLPALPLGYSEETSEAEEREAATDAVVKRAAVWDQTSIYVVGGLGDSIRPVLRSALPASLIAESTFEDIPSDLRKPAEGQTGHIFYDPHAEGLVMGETTAAEHETAVRRAKGMGELADGLSVRPDFQGEEDEELGKEMEDLPVAARAWAATLATARREGLPIFSDDRFVRLTARRSGVPAFGTPALLDVLAEQGSLPKSGLIASRWRIYRSGAWGMKISSAELIELGREDDFEPTPGVQAVLEDVVAWPARGIESIELALSFLNAVHAERPKVFSEWVDRTLGALDRSLGEDTEKWGRLLVSAALNPLRKPPVLTVGAVQALITAVREHEYFQRNPPKSDLVLDAIKEALSLAEEDREKAIYFRLLIDLLGPADRAAAIRTFARHD